MRQPTRPSVRNVGARDVKASGQHQAAHLWRPLQAALGTKLEAVIDILDHVPFFGAETCSQRLAPSHRAAGGRLCAARGRPRRRPPRRLASRQSGSRSIVPFAPVL